jgi:hypothetical protein
MEDITIRQERGGSYRGGHYGGRNYFPKGRGRGRGGELKCYACEENRAHVMGISQKEECRRWRSSHF